MSNLQSSPIEKYNFIAKSEIVLDHEKSEGMEIHLLRHYQASQSQSRFSNYYTVGRKIRKRNIHDLKREVKYEQ